MASSVSMFEKVPMFTQDPPGANSSREGEERDKTQDQQPGKRCLVLLDSRALDRECLARALINHGLGMDVAAFGSIEDWRGKKSVHSPVGAVLLNIGARKITEISAEISKLASEFRPVPVVVLSDSDEIAQILRVLESGARGYIPTSVGVEVCIEAI